jgi:hypothetical protein
MQFRLSSELQNLSPGARARRLEASKSLSTDEDFFSKALLQTARLFSGFKCRQGQKERTFPTDKR